MQRNPELAGAVIALGRAMAARLYLAGRIREDSDAAAAVLDGVGRDCRKIAFDFHLPADEVIGLVESAIWQLEVRAERTANRRRWPSNVVVLRPPGRPQRRGAA